MAWSWNFDRASKRIDGYLAEVKDVEIRVFTKRTDFLDLPVSTAYLVDAAHLYIDIVNARGLLEGGAETEQVHRQALRFLNLHQRATDVILDEAEATKVDFHNQRLHAVVTHPLNDEAGRIHKAIAIADLVIQMLAEVADTGNQHPSAVVRVGIDSGRALAVTNGRRGAREPLFLGNPPNFAAKLAAGLEAGIYLTNSARATVGLPQVLNENLTPLTPNQIAQTRGLVGNGITVERLRESWAADLKKAPLETFEFSRPTPPLRDFDEVFETIGPKNSRRIDSATIFADLDGFTRYVAANLADNPRAVVRALHVLRSEMHAVLHADFGGLKVRFIGDSIHGVLAEGDKESNSVATVSVASITAAATRSSFLLARKKIGGVDELGIAIGFDYGPAALTRLGVRGDLNRCGIGRATYGAEDEQQRSRGNECRIGAAAHKVASLAVQKLFGPQRCRADLTYDVAIEVLRSQHDQTAVQIAEAARVGAMPAIVRAAEYKGRSHLAL